MVPVKTTASRVISRKPLWVEAYEQIYRKIMTLEYGPGQRLEEKHLMAQLGIGRTPIREALMHLTDDFMLESHPNSGVTVRPITLQNTKATFAALQIIELGVAELAVRRDVNPLLLEMKAANKWISRIMKRMDLVDLVEANSNFHHLYARCSGNDYLIDGLHKIRCETNRLAYLSYGNEIDPGRSLKVHYESVIKEHDTIIDTLAKRDEARLKETILKHIDTFHQRIIHYMVT